MPVVRISLIAGRSKEQKAKVAAAITQAIVDHAGSTADQISIIFDEQYRENWAISGKLDTWGNRGSEPLRNELTHWRVAIPR